MDSILDQTQSLRPNHEELSSFLPLWYPVSFRHGENIYFPFLWMEQSRNKTKKCAFPCTAVARYGRFASGGKDMAEVYEYRLKVSGIAER